MEYFYMYILKCSDQSYYVGHTDNLEQRIIQHQNGYFKGYTAHKLPVELVYFEKTQDRETAFALERKVKNWSRKKKQALITQNFGALKKLAKKNF